MMRVHKVENEIIVAICDSGLIGKRLAEGKVVLDLEKYGSFYRGEEAGEKQVLAALKTATSVNAVGKESVAIVRKAMKCDESSVRMIQKVPHLQVYKF